MKEEFIPFNKPCYSGQEDQYVFEAMRSDKISGDGYFTKKCEEWFEAHFNCKRALLTTSCTHALEMAAMLIGIEPGDEVIMPSYTFVSTANAFALRGAKIIFVDIHPDGMNINTELIENAITNKTKAIVPVHYAGMSCNMHQLMRIANKHNIYVIEDAAQALMSCYDGKKLGTFGHISTFSFHETKNITSGGEGGLLVINDEIFKNRSEILREKGTNRSQFFRGMVDKYTWVDIGSSYVQSEIQSAYLWGQIQNINSITNRRIEIFNLYKEKLTSLCIDQHIRLPIIEEFCSHNGHMVYLKCKNIDVRQELIEFLKSKKINAVFHYVPLHSSPAGKKYSKFFGEDKYTTSESERILRLPIWYGLKDSDVSKICFEITKFFNK